MEVRDGFGLEAVAVRVRLLSLSRVDWDVTFEGVRVRLESCLGSVIDSERGGDFLSESCFVMLVLLGARERLMDERFECVGGR